MPTPIQNKKISQLDINGNPHGSNLIPMEADGVTMAIPLSGISSFILPNGDSDIYVTGGTYSNGSATFTNNTGGTFTVSGFLTGSTSSGTDISITGATFTTNNLLTLRNTTGGTVTTTLNNFTGIKITGQTTIGDGFPAGITQYGRAATVANNAYSYGIQEYSFVTANNGFRGYLGVQAWPYITGGVPGTLFGKFAGYVTAFSSAPIWDGSLGGSNQLPNMISLFSALQAQAGGILNTYDIYASEINTVGGNTQNPAVVNHYALYCEPFTYATNNYGIFINGPQNNYFAGRVGVGIQSPSARLHITAGTTTIPPIIINSGVTTTTPINGAIEYNGNHFYGTINGNRYLFDYQITGLTFSNDNLVLTNNTGGTITTTINRFNSISATTISATTFYGDGSNLTGINSGTAIENKGTVSGTVNFDVSTYSHFLLSASTNISMNIQNVQSPSYILIEMKHLNSGTTITNLPGTTAYSFNWASGINDITVLGGMYNGNSWKWLSNTFSGAEPLPTPASFSITASTSANSLSWSSVLSATSYTIDRATDSGFTTSLVLNLNTTTGTTYINTGLTNGTTYYYRLYASANGFLNSSYAYANGTPESGFNTATTVLIAAIEGAGASLTTLEKEAYNNFIVGLKSGTLFNKMRTFYVLGGSFNKSKFNFKNPAENILTSAGTVTFTSNGANGDGSAGTYLDTNSVLPAQNSSAMFASQLTSGSGLESIIGNQNASGGAYLIPGNPLYCIFNGSVTPTSTSNTPSNGRYVVSRTASTGFKVYKNGSEILDANTDTSTTPNGVNITLLTGVGSYPSNETVSCAGTFDGLSGAEASELDSLVSSLETTLGR